MDQSVVPSVDVLWCFTAGAPNETLMELISGLLMAGNTDWIVIPIHGVQALRADYPAPSLSL